MEHVTAMEKAKTIFDQLSAKEAQEKPHWVSIKTFNEVFAKGEVHLNSNNNPEVEFEDFGFELSLRKTFVSEEGTTCVQILTAFNAAEVVYEAGSKLLEEAVIL